MNRSLLVPVLVAAAVLAALPAHAESPFGFRKGMTLEQVRALGEVRPGRSGGFLTLTAPKPHESFGGYNLWFNPSGGLCAVMALGNPVKGDVDGAKLRRAFETYRAFFVKKWGEGFGGKNELNVLWARRSAPRLSPDLERVALVASAGKPGEGSVVILYEFADMGTCREGPKGGDGEGR